MRLLVLLVVDLDSSFERDREGVQRGLPSRDPACSAAACWVEASDREVQAFQSGLFVGEVAARADRTTEASVQALDRVGRVNDFADLGAVGEERHELGPGVLPELDDRRVALAPLAGELVERASSGGFGRRAVHRSQVLGELGPVGLARVPEAVADQMQHAGLNDRLRPDVGDRFGETAEAVADDDADISRAAIQSLGEDLMPVLRPLAAVADPEPEDVALAVDVDADDRVHGPVDDLALPELDVDPCR